MHVVIATPTTHGLVASAFVSSVIVAGQVISEMGGTHTYYSVDGADVVMARNMIANYFLRDERATHLLCLDSDMNIDRQVFRQMFTCGHPFIGTGYPERRINLEGYGDARVAGFDHEVAQSKAMNFNIRLKPGRYTISDNICVAERFGFGCVLINRTVLTALIERGIASIYNNKKARNQAGGETTLYDFFSEIPLPDGDRLSEDYAFCARVRELGDVDPMAYIGSGVQHIGQFSYTGAFIDALSKVETDTDPSDP